jgi:hypothetical protein
MQPVIPWYVTPIVLGMVVALAFWLYRLVALAVKSANLPPDTGASVRRTTALFLGGWLVLALALARSSPSVDAAGNGLVPLSIPLFALVSLGVALGLLLLSPTWRRVVDSIPAGSLISVQIYRLIGGIFLPLYAIGSLPRHFALPAGWGDIAVGLLAPLVALAVRHQIRGARSLALGWNLFGFVDLLVAVGMGTGYLMLALQPGLPAAPGAAAMTSFPLVLIPTFAVPMGFILHLYSIRRTLRGERRAAGGRAQASRQERGAIATRSSPDY